MKIITEKLLVRTESHTDIVDITPKARELLLKTGLKEGSLLLFTIGSTASLATIEFEPGLAKTDLPAFFEKLAPYKNDYAHHQTWGDDNGAAHIRSALLGCSIHIPFIDGELILGTWQQIVVINFDTRARSRELVVQFQGI